MHSKITFILVLFSYSLLFAQTPSGELKRWHKISLSFNGPYTSETANVNPFSDYRLDVTFTHSNTNTTFIVPGFYSGCDDPAENSCDSGAIWKVNFTPGYTGTWNWNTSFKTGNDVAINNGGTSAGFMDGDSGTFQITESDKSGRDHRSPDKGKTTYVNEHYLQYSGTDPLNPNGNWFVKAGADAPENTLAYDDFDNTPNRGNRRKNWNPHQQDYVASEASSYTWNGGKGSELLGVINYLSNKGVNAFSFLTLSLHGDDENVFPYLLKVSENIYNGYDDNQQWNQGVYKDRFDVSKLAQWERIFEYADKKGMFMHFKTMETENDNIMDNNSFGRERKLYYRELIARFGHHLALNWNITEETTLTDAVAIETSNYINAIDPYNNLIVLHTYPNQQNQKYTPLLGNNSSLTGASIQIDKDQVHNMVKTWVENSKNSGKKWVVANDEQGSANIGVDQDPNDNKLVRHEVLWGALMAGGAGVEYYYGYQTGITDLNAQDHRSRDTKYTHASYALQFFNDHLQNYLPDMVSSDAVTNDNNDYVYAKPNEVYVVYRPDGGTTAINLPAGNWTVSWYNPRSGGNLTTATDITNTLVAPDNNDWVALITGNATNPNCTSSSIDAIPLDDAYLQGATHFNTTELRTENNNRLSYLKFTVPTTTETVTAVKLELTVSSDPGNGIIEIHRGNTNNWTETNLSNTNKPTENGLLGALDTTYSIGNSYEWILNGVTQGETISLIIKQTNGNDVSFSSKEGNNAPTLKLEYGDCDNNNNSNDCAALEQNGIVAIEAEHYDSLELSDVRQWITFNPQNSTGPTPDPDPSHANTASASGYIEILPDTRVTHQDQLINNVNFTNTAGQMTIVNYKVKFTTTGKYYVWVRAYSTGTEDNGVHVGLDGTWPESGKRMQWCEGKNQWTWASKQRTAANHCGEEQLIYLDINTVGIHTISFSMREDGFEMDKIILNKVYVSPNGPGPDEQLVNCGSLSTTDYELDTKIKIHPNPVQNTLHIENIHGNVTLYDLYGRAIKSNININDANKTIDVSKLSSGVYFLAFKNKQVVKFLKK